MRREPIAALRDWKIQRNAANPSESVIRVCNVLFPYELPLKQLFYHPR